MFIDLLSSRVIYYSLCVLFTLQGFVSVSRQTISELALFQHLAEALAELIVALVLGTLDELFELIRAGLLLLRGLLLHVHGLWLLLVGGLSLVRFLVCDIRPGRL